jgi:hypothetical protein
MLEITPTVRPVVLRSPFNGERFVVPPDMTPQMLDALLNAGFVKLEDDAPAPARKRKDS